YAVVVDALASAALCALLGALFAVVLELVHIRWRPATIAAAYVAGAAAAVLLLVGLFWSYTMNGADREVGVPLGPAVLIIVLAVVVGAVLYWLSQTFADAMFASVPRVAIIGISLTLCLALIVPGQVAVEGMQHNYA